MDDSAESKKNTQESVRVPSRDEKGITVTWLRSLFDGVLLIAVGTGALYLHGLFYARGFFSVFPISEWPIEIPDSYLLGRGFFASGDLILLSLIIVVLLARPVFPNRDTRQYLALAIFGFAMALFFSESWLTVRAVSISAVLSMMLFLPAFENHMRENGDVSRAGKWVGWFMVFSSAFYELTGRRWKEYVGIVALLALFLSAAHAQSLGDHAARQVITGNRGTIVMLDLAPNAPLSSTVAQHQLSVFWESADAYYFVEVVKVGIGETIHPTVYVVPKSQVLSLVAH